jgi:hypothetical protein
MTFDNTKKNLTLYYITYIAYEDVKTHLHMNVGNGLNYLEKMSILSNSMIRNTFLFMG